MIFNLQISPGLLRRKPGSQGVVAFFAPAIVLDKR
jgi:hypothetical protein